MKEENKYYTVIIKLTKRQHDALLAVAEKEGLPPDALATEVLVKLLYRYPQGGDILKGKDDDI